MNMRHTNTNTIAAATVAALAALLLAACSDNDDRAPDTPATPPPVQALPQLTAATGATLASCTDLAARLSYPDTTISAVNPIAAGTLAVGGKPVAAHCQVTGRDVPRVSPVDGKSYAIGFEMRLPLNWNGRFFYQANGGIDGSVVHGHRPGRRRRPADNALNQGFAVISSDAGHAGSTGPFFGIDPQARLDYGYQAVGKLTPMAKA
jgi:hypothetical protein